LCSPRAVPRLTGKTDIPNALEPTTMPVYKTPYYLPRLAGRTSYATFSSSRRHLIYGVNLAIFRHYLTLLQGGRTTCTWHILTRRVSGTCAHTQFWSLPPGYVFLTQRRALTYPSHLLTSRHFCTAWTADAATKPTTFPLHAVSIHCHCPTPARYTRPCQRDGTQPSHLLTSNCLGAPFTHAPGPSPRPTPAPRPGADLFSSPAPEEAACPGRQFRPSRHLLSGATGLPCWPGTERPWQVSPRRFGGLRATLQLPDVPPTFCHCLCFVSATGLIQPHATLPYFHAPFTRGHTFHLPSTHTLAQPPLLSHPLPTSFSHLQLPLLPSTCPALACSVAHTFLGIAMHPVPTPATAAHATHYLRTTSSS